MIYERLLMTKAYQASSVAQEMVEQLGHGDFFRCAAFEINHR